MARYAVEIGKIILKSDKPISPKERTHAIKQLQWLRQSVTTAKNRFEIVLEPTKDV